MPKKRKGEITGAWIDEYPGDDYRGPEMLGLVLGALVFTLFGFVLGWLVTFIALA